MPIKYGVMSLFLFLDVKNAFSQSAFHFERFISGRPNLKDFMDAWISAVKPRTKKTAI